MTFTDRQKLVAVSPIFLATGLLARPKRSRVFFRAGPEKKEGPINAEPQLGSQPRREAGRRQLSQKMWHNRDRSVEPTSGDMRQN